ncbi:hypothetical protein AQ490_05965 [Wenjunlia vitaminophila]|uniref:Uncharacterized protein n=1 Tax=Wenjunlia vitaminophila TaxID=76728 RepID=A0A0T6LPR5_WENVI|nr:hypothetical protein [Wenjunlia vitaminophila]KRV47945.1 hypothetical protein AQ490_05965 [Wenjunlia vitaminophila]
MSRDEVDRALARLASEYEAIESSLLALQDHAGRRLLEGADLTGLTRDRWTFAEQAISLLWVHFDAYTEALAEARAVRARRNRPSVTDLAELTELLSGSGVTVAGGRVPDGARALTGPARLTEQVSLQDLVDRMNGWYAQALEVVTAADAVWSALPARIDLLTAEVRRVRSLAGSVGVRPGEHPAGDDLERIVDEVAALRDRVVADPLAFWSTDASTTSGGSRPGRPDTAGYDRLARELEEVRREVEAVLRVRDEADERLYRVHDVLARADATLAEARGARGEVLAKIAAVEVPAVSGPATGLRERVALAVTYRRAAQWQRLSPLLDALEQGVDEELARARESLTAVTEPLAVRAELRGRLDAYKAKAARLGLAEDPELLERHDIARRLLWSAPCDLRAAGQAVRRYQESVAEALAPTPVRNANQNHWGRT